MMHLNAHQMAIGCPDSNVARNDCQSPHWSHDGELKKKIGFKMLLRCVLGIRAETRGKSARRRVSWEDTPQLFTPGLARPYALKGNKAGETYAGNINPSVLRLRKAQITSAL